MNTKKPNKAEDTLDWQQLDTPHGTFITLEQARMLENSGAGITRKSMLNKIHAGSYPEGVVISGPAGYFVNLEKFIGLQ